MSALIAVYAKDDEHSFNEIPDLIDRAFEEIADPEGIVVVIVGNKSDLEEGVDESKARKLIEEEVADEFFAVSAKNGTKVNDVFEFIARKIKAQSDD